MSKTFLSLGTPPALLARQPPPFRSSGPSLVGPAGASSFGPGGPLSVRPSRFAMALNAFVLWPPVLAGVARVFLSCRCGAGLRFLQRPLRLYLRAILALRCVVQLAGQQALIIRWNLVDGLRPFSFTRPVRAARGPPLSPPSRLAAHGQGCRFAPVFYFLAAARRASFAASGGNPPAIIAMSCGLLSPTAAFLY